MFTSRHKYEDEIFFVNGAITIEMVSWFVMVSCIALEEFVVFLDLSWHMLLRNILLKLANHIFKVSARQMDVALHSVARQSFTVLIGPLHLFFDFIIPLGNELSITLTLINQELCCHLHFECLKFGILVFISIISTLRLIVSVGGGGFILSQILGIHSLLFLLLKSLGMQNISLTLFAFEKSYICPLNNYDHNRKASSEWEVIHLSWSESCGMSTQVDPV